MTQAISSMSRFGYRDASCRRLNVPAMRKLWKKSTGSSLWRPLRKFAAKTKLKSSSTCTTRDITGLWFHRWSKQRTSSLAKSSCKWKTSGGTSLSSSSTRFVSLKNPSLRTSKPGPETNSDLKGNTSDSTCELTKSCSITRERSMICSSILVTWVVCCPLSWLYYTLILA